MTKQTSYAHYADAVAKAKEWATGLKIGSEFRGCRPEAERRFPGDLFAQGVFVTTALNHLPKNLRTALSYTHLTLPTNYTV